MVLEEFVFVTGGFGVGEVVEEDAAADYALLAPGLGVLVCGFGGMERMG